VLCSALLYLLVVIIKSIRTGFKQA
jgi:hypothetical protein